MKGHSTKSRVQKRNTKTPINGMGISFKGGFMNSLKKSKKNKTKLF